jgi:hypothetical protein
MPAEDCQRLQEFKGLSYTEKTMLKSKIEKKKLVNKRLY